MNFRAFLATLIFPLGITLVASAARANDVPIRGQTGLARIDNHTGLPRLAKVRSRPPRGSLFPIPVPGGPNDPRAAGGTFRKCKFPTGTEWEKIELRPENWRGLGAPVGSRGWRYRGAGTPDDPCTSILVRPTQIKVTCKGPGSLDPQFTLPVGGDSVVDELTLGTLRYCTKFDRPFRKDSVRRGNWRSKGAPAPVSCPAVEATPTPVPTPTVAPTATPQPTPTPTAPPPPYGSTSGAFVDAPRGLLE